LTNNIIEKVFCFKKYEGKVEEILNLRKMNLIISQRWLILTFNFENNKSVDFRDEITVIKK